jgi:hypothetical protein
VRLQELDREKEKIIERQRMRLEEMEAIIEGN